MAIFSNNEASVKYYKSTTTKEATSILLQGYKNKRYKVRVAKYVDCDFINMEVKGLLSVFSPRIFKYLYWVMLPIICFLLFSKAIYSIPKYCFLVAYMFLLCFIIIDIFNNHCLITFLKNNLDSFEKIKEEEYYVSLKEQ